MPWRRRPPSHVFALGESMGAGIALEAAAYDSRLEAVVAEAFLLVYRGQEAADFPPKKSPRKKPSRKEPFPCF